MILVRLISFVAVVVLMLGHLFAGKLYFIETIPRSRWLSAAGGVSVAYVFVHLLPELSEAQETLVESGGEWFIYLENHVYLMALVGLSVFYGLEMMVVKSRKRPGQGELPTVPQVFWLHILSFALYNSLIGYYLFQKGNQGLAEITLFTVTMLLHLLVNDYSLREHHKDVYRTRGRWLLSGAIVIGWSMGFIVEISELLLAGLLSFLAGGIILNILKEELPEEKKSHFPAFALGAGFYTVLLVIAGI